jgi:hypothetical protein
MSRESIIQEIKAEIGTLTQVLHLLEGGKTRATKQAKAPRKISAAGRRRIAAAQKLRWKKIREAAKK